jgi:hypothetical protein
MPAYTTLAAFLAGLACFASSTHAADSNQERPPKAIKPSAASSGIAAPQRSGLGSRSSAPMRWDALDPRTIERAEKRRSVDAPSFPPERQ